MFQFKDDFKTPKASIKTDSKKARQAALSSMIRGVQSGASRVEAYLPGLLDQAIESNVWSWPRDTLRKNGSRAGGTRNIIDTGALKASKSVKTTFLQTKTVFTVSYKAPYATLTHYGGYILPYGDVSRSPVYVPGRPWVEAVLTGNNSGVAYLETDTIMEEAIQREWSS